MRYIRFDNSNSKLGKYEHGYMLYPYAILIAIATKTLKLNQCGDAIVRVDIAQ